MHPSRLWKLCEVQLYLLILALPFEYCFNKAQPLLTTLKLQVLALALTWACLKTSEFIQSRNQEWKRLKGVLSRRLLLAMIAFALIQILAATFAPAFRGNAMKAA